MVSSLVRFNIRKNFGRIPEVVSIPNLISLQKASYEQFLFSRKLEGQNLSQSGLHEVFASVFPIRDYSGRIELHFFKYDLEAPKYEVSECRERGMTYAAALKATFRLIVWDLDEETGARTVRDIKEQDVYMGDLPLMTEYGTFLINGIERVIVSQMHRSPGVLFDSDKGKTHPSGKHLLNARIIPYRGSWCDFEFDARDLLYVRIDRRRKFLASTFLMALENEASEHHRLAHPEGASRPHGMSREDILAAFYETRIYKKLGRAKTADEGWHRTYAPQEWGNVKLVEDLINAETQKVAASAGAKLTARGAQKLYDEGLRWIAARDQDLEGRFSAVDFILPQTGEILVEAGDEINTDSIHRLLEEGYTEIPVLAIDHVNVGAYLRNTLAADKNTSREEALIEIYRILRPGEPPTLDGVEGLFRGLFFDADRYDLSAVGRVKLNERLDLDVPDTVRTLRREDIIAILRYLLNLKDGRGRVDDIDSLGNRRVRSVGELLENQFRIGLARMEKAIRERMGSVDVTVAMPNDLINAKPVSTVIREFFGSSQLSQFMDQTNPLAEITHKRRLSALGPGGLTRDRAGFEVRDVHPTHYGRICPIETPEGPNIGLINSLASYARVNPYGFIESPYRLVKDGVVSSEVVYMTAVQEEKYTIAQANEPLDAQGRLLSEQVSCRRAGEFVLALREDVQMMDVSPKQLVSVAASLIPFLENDDANRALMGSNMQRQAVPLVHAEAPLVGTGMEAVVARDSGAVVVARRSGVVDQVDTKRIVIRVTGDVQKGMSGVDIYNLLKYKRSNQSTCINQRPLVSIGDEVCQGDIIADGPSTDHGELALGHNVLVAFMPWKGYTFEDSIVISERLVRDDVFTSIHIEEFEVMARDTKLGHEEISRDIPNVSEEALRHLDEAGIVHIGAEVRPGDILIGKVTPKGETPMTPEEKLLRAIFGEKAADVRDTSLRVPPGVSGTVVDVCVLSRRGVEKDERSLAIEKMQIDLYAKDRDAEKSILERHFYARLKALLLGQKLQKVVGKLKAGTVLSEASLEQLTQGQWRQIAVVDDAVMADIEELHKQINDDLLRIQKHFESRVEKLRRGDDLPPGVMKVVKVFVAVKRKLQPGDKMAGRHGNKGVISVIVPVEDMPHLEDGTPVDMVLNPLGVPSRMNVGQILETHLGWAAAKLGAQLGDLLKQVQRGQTPIQTLRSHMHQVLGAQYTSLADLPDSQILHVVKRLAQGVPMATPVFDGATEADIVSHLGMAGLPLTGQVTLIDGRTGEPFDRPVTVGYIYMIKLHHLVDDKIHARSIGPYSLVTQQPLGGKAQFGGQRFGEMEVWALEAYGASYTLQEMLTIKSDDVVGRTKAYEAIIRGDHSFEPGIPESFNVLVKELQALGLDVNLNQDTTV